MSINSARHIEAGLRASRGRPSPIRQIAAAYLARAWPGALLAALSMLGVAAADLLAPWPLKVLIDHVLLGAPADGLLGALLAALAGRPALAVGAVALGIVLIALLRGACAAGQIYQTSRVGFGLSAEIQRRLFGHLQRLSLGFHSQARSGELLTKVTSDTKNLRDIFAESLLDTGAQLITLAGMCVTMLLMNWRLSLVVLAFFPLLAAGLYRLSRRIKGISRSQRRLEGQLAARISEGLAALPLIQAFGRERYEHERFTAASEEALDASIRAARAEAAGTRTIEIVSAAGVAAVVLFGGIQALGGALSPGDLLVFVAYVTSMFKPVRSLARLSMRFSKAIVSAERIDELLGAEPEVRDRRTTLPALGLRGQIEFAGVGFSYGGGKPALRDVSFRVGPGQRVALVGASGAGKSTIAGMLLRFHNPSAGYILVDGVDIRDYSRESLRQQIGAVLQDSLLIGATVAENIAYGRPEATMAEIVAAARLAQAHDFIAGLPEGYQTMIGERGATLSGGQRQRISLARALIKRPAILILDEPTSAVDAESARQIEQALFETQRGRTTLVIAHHFAAMERFDQIIVLRDGAVVERGAHADLLARGGYYAELTRLQAGAAADIG